MHSTKHYFSLILQKSTFDLISESRRGYIGILWWIIEPVANMAVFYVLYAVLFNRGGEDRVAFLLSGLVVWKWFTTSVIGSAHCISANVGLIRQVHIPKVVLPGMVVMTNTIKFLIVFVLLISFLVIIGKNPSVAWFSLPALMGIQLLVMLSIGSVLAAIVPFFPDLKLIIENGMQLLFYLSGVFFDIKLVPPAIKPYLYLHPMVVIVESYRVILLEGRWPDWVLLGTLIPFSLAGLALGWYLLCRFDRTYAKVL